MFAIIRFSISPVAGTESLYRAKWLCSGHRSDGLTALLDGSSTHDAEGDKWNADADVRHSSISNTDDIIQLAMLEFDIEQQCALDVGEAIHSRLMSGDFSLTQSDDQSA